MSLTSDIIKATNPTESEQRAIHLLFKDNMNLARCETGSIIEAIKYCQLMGWLPGKMFKQAYFIPYGNKVQLIPGYKGLLKLAMETGYYKMFTTDSVHENDTFVPPQTTDKGFDLYHKQYGKLLDECGNRKNPDKPFVRGNLYGAYARSVAQDGYWNCEFVTINDVWQAAMKGKSKGGKVPLPTDKTLEDIYKLGGAYVDFTREMFRVRALAKHVRDLDISPRLAEAIDLVDKQPEREVKQVKYQTEEDVINSMNGGV